jgi:glycerol-3-phosphate acyltransferase PlsY
VLTLAGDCVKGVLGALIGKYFGGELGMVLGGFFAVLGHDFPVFSRFKGGKGIATSLGITIVICPLVAPWLCVIVLGLLPFIRIMSVCSLLATACYPVLYYFLLPEGADMALYMPFAIVMAILSVYCHRSNIVRLIRGEENKLDFGKINKISKKFMQMRRDKRSAEK